MLIGHAKTSAFFASAIANGSLAHAYCLAGVDQIGKRTLSKEIAGRLLGVESEKLEAHPDFYYLCRQSDEKSGKLRKDISVAQARELRLRLQNRSWLSGYQVVIVDEAELLNAESGNALLKLLEEPAEKSAFFLLTENAPALLPTIRSRCQLFNLTLVDEEKITTALVDRGCEQGLARQITSWAWGRPGKALELLADEEKRAELEKNTELFARILRDPVHERWQGVKNFFNDKEGLVRTKETLLAVLDLWQMLARRQMLEGHPAATPVIESMNVAKMFLAQNVGPQLVLEHMLASF